MKPENLPDHPVFFRLSDSGRNRLLQSSELWEAAAGARLFYPGDSGEELILLLDGRLESDTPGGVKCWLPGDLWGENRLAAPSPLDSSLIAVEDSRWISWPREALLTFLTSSSTFRKALTPLTDSNGRLLSGFPDMLPLPAGSGKMSRRIRPSLRPVLAGLIPAVLITGLLFTASLSSEILPRMLYLVSPAVYAGWLLVFLIKRLTREYGVETDAVTSRTFDWGHFTVESRHVPIDRIQGVETEKNGVLRHILRMGNLIVKTSALDGVLILQGVNNPEALRSKILDIQKSESRRVKGREREDLRRSLEGSGLGAVVPLRIEGPGPGTVKGKSREEGMQFRKSSAVLLGRLILPLLISFIPILGVRMLSELLSISGIYIITLSLLPLLWALYRFEDWRNDSYQVTGGYAVDLYRKPLGLKESRRQVELASVQNIRTEQKGLIPFLFRYGDVILVTAGGAADTVFKSVSKPWRVQESLFSYREADLRRRELSSREQRKDDFVRFAEALDQIRGSSQPSSLSPGRSDADYSK